MAEKHNFLSLNIACNYSQVAIKALFMIRLSVFLTSAVANYSALSEMSGICHMTDHP